jgi:hypothetical protein
MTPDNYQWLTDHHQYLYGRVSIKREDWSELYRIYNETYNENKKPNGCGACQRSTLDRLKVAYEAYQANDSQSVDRTQL